MRVSVSTAVLRWALERSGKQAILEKKFPKLPQWLTGEVEPTLRQLEKFAKVTSVPFGYLFLSEPPEERLPIPFFRTLRDDSMPQPSPDFLELVQTMEYRQAWMRDYLIEEGYEPLEFVGSARKVDTPEYVAEQIRSTLGLKKDWAEEQSTWTAALRELQERMEEAGILVVISGVVGNNTHRKLDPEEFRGFVLIDEYAPLVFVNGADSKAAQMFTLAHELAHVWLGQSAAFDLRELQPASDEVERACDQIAAEFLVPAQELKQFWLSIVDESDRFEAVARKFKVSRIVAARRALDLRLITRKEFLEFYREYQKEERKTARYHKGGDFYALQTMRIGRRFAEAVVRAVREGKLFYKEAYRLTGLYGSTFERFAKHLLTGGPA